MATFGELKCHQFINRGYLSLGGVMAKALGQKQA